MTIYDTITNQIHSIIICICKIYCKILHLIAKFAINYEIICRNIVHFVGYGIKIVLLYSFCYLREEIRFLVFSYVFAVG